MKSSPDQLFEDPSGSRRKTKDISVRLSRDAAYRIAQGLPQAIMKVVSYGHDPASVGRQLDYISREGGIELEDPDGETLSREEVKERLLDWKVDFDTRRKRSRESLHMILSSPKGSSVLAVEEAARRFAGDIFSENHDYLFATHQDTNNIHVHLVVKMRGHDGRKLNPGRLDLRRWRDAYASHMRAVGIDVEASPRLARGVGRKNIKSHVLRLNRELEDGARVHRASFIEARQNYQRGIDPSEQPWAVLMRSKTERYRQALLSTASSMVTESEAVGDRRLGEKGCFIQQFAARLQTPMTVAEERLLGYQQVLANEDHRQFDEEMKQHETRRRTREAARQVDRPLHPAPDPGSDTDVDFDMDFEP